MVLTPTRELAIQVYQNLRQILEAREGIKVEDDKEKTTKMRLKETKVMMCIGGIPFEDDKKKYIEHGAHIIVGTVGRVYEMLTKNVINFNKLMTLTMDEGDKIW